MTPSTVTRFERDRLERIAADFRMQGYEVKVQPRSGDLPSFLAGFEPDLVVSGKGEILVVEVKTRSELKNALALPALEAAVQNQPGWRFELIIDGAETQIQRTLNPTQIRAMLQQAADLEQPRFSAAALLVLWSAIEGALRLLAEREGVDLESLAAGYVVNKLYTVGLLGREQYDALKDAMHLRAQAAHGFQVSVKSEDIFRISSILNQLLNQVEVKAA